MVIVRAEPHEPRRQCAVLMDFEYRSICCHVSIAVTVMSAAEITAIVLSYLTNLEHPLMRCLSYNVSVLEPFASDPRWAEHRLCSTSAPLLFWIILHLFTDIFALIAIQTVKYRWLIPYLITTVMDVLLSSAYLCVLLSQIIMGEQIEKSLVVFIVGIVLFKVYDLLCGRRLYWYLQWRFDARFTPRSTVVQEEDQFQF